jgi:gliding motility-associated-like protein
MLLCAFFCIKNVQAQNYYLSNNFNSGDVVTTCNGRFYDDGGPNANYNQNQSWTVTFKPGIPTGYMQLIFDLPNSFKLNTGATLEIFDGMNTTDSLLGGSVLTDAFNNILQNGFAFTATDTNTSRALTVRFNSSTTAVPDFGWNVRLKCVPACQRFTGIIQTTPASINESVSICPGDRVDFRFRGNYGNNNQGYVQADNLNKYIWNFVGRDSITNGVSDVSRSFQQGGYKIKLTVIDSNNCRTENILSVKVKTGIRPRYSFTAPEACFRDSVTIFGNIDNTTGYTTGTFENGFTNTGSFIQPPLSGDSIFLPDGTGVTYSTTITVTQFLPGQRLTNVALLKGIFAKMEHSYLGDLRISIVAPNGVEVSLKGYPGGGDCYMGEPVDRDNLPNVRGKGYNYTWSMSAQYRKMVQEANRWNYSYTDNSGFSVVNHLYLREGSYLPETDFNALVGTPLNGNWVLKITDNLAIDNGYIFNWGLDFDPILYPDPELYRVGLASYAWLPAPGLIRTFDNGVNAVVYAPNPGTYPYTFQVRDSFNCVYDTIVNVLIRALPNKPYLGPDSAICNGQILPLTVANPQVSPNFIYTWSNGATGYTTNITLPDTYIVTGTDGFGCKEKDTVVITRATPYSVSLGNDFNWCKSSPATLNAQIISSGNPNIVSYKWQDNSTGPTFLTAGAGTYYVSAFNNIGCFETDTIVVGYNPINDYLIMPRDTSICDLTTITYRLNLPVTASVLWADGTVGTEYTVSDSGIYKMTATTSDGCTRTDSMRVAIRPLPVFSLGPNQTSCNGFDVKLTANYPGATYRWSNGDRTASTLVSNTGDYFATATFNACNYSDTVNIVFTKCDCNPKVVNAFSPNGDGINDIWKPYLECRPLKYDLQIYNRYGQNVLDNQNWRNGWNGKQNGVDLPVGVYYYVFQYFDEVLQKSFLYKGSITLLR